MKKQKKGKCTMQSSGVTLVALILTIIILLILVATSVTLVIRWNIIEKSEYATDKYQIAAEKESIDLAYENYTMLDAKDEDGNPMVDGADVEKKTDGKGWTVTFPNGHVYDLDEDGNITGPTAGDGIGEENGGAPQGGENSGGSDNEQGDQPQNPENKFPDVSEKNAGDEIQWDGDGDGAAEDWLVVEKTETETTLVSKNAMGSLTLGKECKWTIGDNEESLDWENETIKKEADAINEDGSLSDMEKAIYSYNHAIEIINEYCRKLIKNAPPENVKSLGVDEESDTKDMYTSEVLQTWIDGKYNGKGRVTNKTYSTPWSTMTEEQKKSNQGYWLSSRDIYAYSNRVMFQVLYIYKESAGINYGPLWKVNNDNTATSFSASYAVRPVVTITSQE